jgi:hypothetical protein
VIAVLGEYSPMFTSAGNIRRAQCYAAMRRNLRLGVRLVHAKENVSVGFKQYHEPAKELPDEVRTFARVITSLLEEAQAIDWYNQRMAVEKNDEARQLYQHAQAEEFVHFSMDLEFLTRQMPAWKDALQQILFKPGNIVQNAKKGESQVPNA